MKPIIQIVKIANHLLSMVVGLFILIIFCYGSYSLWDIYRIQHEAFLSEKLAQLQPTTNNYEASFAELRKINPDVKAWITIDHTHINYPVLQGKDDLEYVNKNVYGKFALSGSIFLSSQNKGDFSEHYQLTFGHHMSNGGMYGDVDKMSKRSYLKKHRTGKLYLPNRTYKIELYAVLQCDAYNQQIYHVDTVNNHLAEFQAYLKSHALQYIDIPLTDEDQFIALTTCDSNYTFGRTVAVGKLTLIT